MEKSIQTSIKELDKLIFNILCTPIGFKNILFEIINFLRNRKLIKIKIYHS